MQNRERESDRDRGSASYDRGSGRPANPKLRGRRVEKPRKPREGSSRKGA